MKGGNPIFRRSLRQSTLLLAAALVPALAAALWHPRRPEWVRSGAEIPAVSWAEVSGWSGQAVLVDARPADVFARRHIPGALSLPESRWEEQLPEFIRAWRPGMRVVVYCDDRTCDASQEVALRLRRELGIGDVFVLQGGWTAWVAAQAR